MDNYYGIFIKGIWVFFSFSFEKLYFKLIEKKSMIRVLVSLNIGVEFNCVRSCEEVARPRLFPH